MKGKEKKPSGCRVLNTVPGACSCGRIAKVRHLNQGRALCPDCCPDCRPKERRKAA